MVIDKVLCNGASARDPGSITTVTFAALVCSFNQITSFEWSISNEQSSPGFEFGIPVDHNPLYNQ